MTTITARALWESARPLVDRADELGIPIASIHVSRWGRVELYVRDGMDEDRRDDVDRLSADPAQPGAAWHGPTQYFGSMYSRANAFGDSGLTLPNDARVTVQTRATLGVETDDGQCLVSANDLRIFRDRPEPCERGGVIFTPDLLGALDQIAARELAVSA